MAKIVDFKLSDEEYIELAERKLNGGDVESAISYLKSAVKQNDCIAKAYVLFGKIYAGFGAYQISNTALYRALVSCPTEEDESRAFYMLANNFLELGDGEAVSYYMRYFGDDFVFPTDFDEEPEAEFRLIEKGSDNSEALISEAYSLMQATKFDEAIALAKKVNQDGKFAAAANHVILVCYMMKNDVDRVIEEGNAMLAKNDSLAVRSTVATAYLMEERMDEACRVTEKLLENDYTKLEEILIVLPLAVNLNMHSEVVKYTMRVLEKLHFQPNNMMWLSQALYNLGQKEEATKVMNRMRNIYGDYCAADYYLSLYAENPDSVEYNVNMPYSERLNRYREIERYMRYSNDDLKSALEMENSGVAGLIRWAFIDGNEKITSMIMGRLAFFRSDWTERFYRERLISPDLQFDAMSNMLGYIVNDSTSFTGSIVTQDRFKDVNFELPICFYHTTGAFRNALRYCVCDIIFTDEDPTTYLGRFTAIVNELACAVVGDKILWSSKEREKIPRMRSMKTIVGALISEVYYDEPDAIEDAISRYGLSRTVLNKYRKIMFGGSDSDEN